MSKLEDCALFARKGKYCCTEKRERVGDKECLQLTVINGPDVELKFFPSGNINDPFVSIPLEEGVNNITTPGTYLICPDCASLDGTEAPDDAAAQMMICACIVAKDSYALLAALCIKLEDIAGGGPGDTTVADLLNMECS